MSKTETMRRLSDAAIETRVERLASQIEAVRQAKHQSAEDLAAMLEPLAQAMAALTDETRQTLVEIDRSSREQVEATSRQLSELMARIRDAAAAAEMTAERLRRAGARRSWPHYALATLTGVITAALVTASWLLLAPRPEIKLDPAAVARLLAPAVTEAVRPSGNR